MALYACEGIAKSFQENPTRIAFNSEEAITTYAELDEKSASFASWMLHEFGEKYVAVLCDRSVDVAIAHIAALRAGKVLVALDPREPIKRTSAILEILGCSVLFSSDVQMNKSFDRVQIISELFDQNSKSRKWSDWKPNDDCWIYFTSGSSGEPKGVPVPYKRRIPNNFMGGILKPGDKVGITRPVSFLAGGTALISSLVEACEISQFDLSVLNAHDLMELVAEHHISHLQLPPSLFRDEKYGREQYQYEGCVEITMTGERCTRADLENLQKLFPRASCLNSYGSTELGTVARHIFLPGDELPEDPVPVGMPFDCEIYIVDTNYGVLTQGEIGQIAVVSERRASNYISAIGIIPLNEFQIRQGVKAVLTGDAGYLGKDGLLRVIGRMDDIVKINGNLTNIASVASALKRHHDVANAEVLAFNSKKNRLKLGAVVVTRDDARINSRTLREFLLTEIPAWMVPTRFTFIKEMPITNRGKTDRQKLLQQIVKSDKGISGSSDLGNPVTWRILVFLNEFVDVEDLDQFDNLQFCGLDSLDIVEFVEMINDEFSVRLPISFFAAHWSIASLQRWLIDRGGNKLNRIVTVSSGTRSIDLYWLMPGTNLVVGLPLANYLQEYTSRFLVAKGAESRNAPYLETKLIARELIEQTIRQLDFQDFVLFGFSSASWIVQQMAVSMKEMGLAPKALVLLDPPFGDAVETSSAPPKPELLMRAREGQLVNLRQHDADVGLLTLQMFGLRHHARSSYDGNTLVITSHDEDEVTESINSLFSHVSIECVDAEHLELMRNPEIIGPSIRKFLDSLSALR